MHRPVLLLIHYGDYVEPVGVPEGAGVSQAIAEFGKKARVDVRGVRMKALEAKNGTDEPWMGPGDTITRQNHGKHFLVAPDPGLDVAPVLVCWETRTKGSARLLDMYLPVKMKDVICAYCEEAGKDYRPELGLIRFDLQHPCDMEDPPEDAWVPPNHAITKEDMIVYVILEAPPVFRSGSALDVITLCLHFNGLGAQTE